MRAGVQGFMVGGLGFRVVIKLLRRDFRLEMGVRALGDGPSTLMLLLIKSLAAAGEEHSISQYA